MDINNELKQLACDFNSVVILSEAATAIDTWYGQYQDFLSDMQGGSVIPVSTLQTWVNNVLNGSGTDQSALSATWGQQEPGTRGRLLRAS